MALPDYIFTEGFDKYGPTGEPNISTNITLFGEWTSAILNSGPGGMNLVAALSGTGYALSISEAGSSGGTLLNKTVSGNFPRVLGGYTFSVATLSGGNQQGIQFNDGSTAQLSIGINDSGHIEVRRGGFASGTVIGTSTSSYSPGTNHVLEYDVTFSAASGIVKIWVDTILTSINLTGQNTKTTANAYSNAFTLGAGTNFNSYNITFDHLYFWGYLAAGGSETPALTNPIIETQFPISDDTKVFTFGAAVFGQVYSTVATTTTNAPGANRLSLRKYTAEVAGTLNAINIIPGATSVGVKNKGVIYADSSGAPGTLLSSGNEIVGMTSGTTLLLPLVTPQSLVAGTVYWIGYITDTSVAVRVTDASNLGYGAANTYASGAPGTAPAMTSAQSSWMMWGSVSGVATNWNEVNKNPPLGNLSYVQSSTIGDEDLYNFPALSSTPSVVYSVAVKANVAKSDSGARTVDLRTKSVSTSSSGSNTGLAPLTTYSFLASYFTVDPATGVAWVGSGVNAARHGLKIAS